MPASRSICVYCGSSLGNERTYAQAATILGTAIGKAGYRLVYGGGTNGIMGTVARATLEAGGSVLGVIPGFLKSKEASGEALTGNVETIVTADMHQRKHHLFDQSDAFVTLPGGIGTLEELFETFTWLQLGFHKKPIGLLDVNGYYEKLTGFLDHMVAENFLRADQLAMLHRATDPAALLDELTRFEAPDTDRWYERSEFV